MTTADSSSENSKLNHWLRGWIDRRRLRFWLLVACLTWTLFGFFLAPLLVRWIMESEVEALNRTVAIEDIQVNPWTMTILVSGAELRDTDDELILSYDEYFWNFQASSLFRWAWTFAEIRLVGLYIHEERFAVLDTRYTRLLKSLADQGVDEETNENAEVETEPSPPPRIIIHQFALTNGNFTLTDRVAGDFKGDFGPIDVSIRDIRTIPDYSGAQSVRITTAGGGQIEWSGDLQLVPFSSSGKLAISGNGLADFFRYSDHFLPFVTHGEGVRVDLDYRIALQDDEFQMAIRNLHASFNGSQVRLDDADSNIISLNSITIRNGSFDLPENKARFDSMVIDGPVIDLGLESDGQLNLLQLIPPFLAELENDAEADTATDTEPFLVELGLFQVTNGTLELFDNTRQEPFKLTLDKLQLDLEAIDNREGTLIPVALSSDVSSGGQFSFEGSIGALPELVASGRFSAQNLDLAPAQEYLQDFARINLESAVLNVAADIEHNPQQLLDATGEMTVTAFELRNQRNNERLTSWETLSLDRFELDMAGSILETSILEFNGLFGRFHIAEDLSTNIDGLLIEGEDAASETAMLDVQLGGISITEGELDFSDMSLPLPFQARISSLEGTISTLSTNSREPSTIALEGQVNEFGQARIEGDINAWAPTDLAAIDMTFRNLDLSRLSPYTIQFAGYQIDDGRMDLDLGYQLDQGQMKGENSIVIREIQLGEKVDHPDAASLPLGLAVALLSDADGVIDLDVPVEGDLNDPEFKIGGVVWQAIGNLISKVVTAPFRLLGSLVGIDSEDFGVLRFAPGEAEVSPPDLEQILKLSEALTQRPELLVEVAGPWSTDLDSIAIAQATLDAEINTGLEAMEDDGRLSLEREQDVLESVAISRIPGFQAETARAGHTVTEDGQDPAFDQPAYLADLKEQLLATIQVDDTQLASLASNRASAVSQAMLEAGINPASIKEADSLPVDAGEERYVPMELTVDAGN